MVQKPEIQEPRVTVRGTVRPVTLSYARRLLPRARLHEPDPYCRACGHRARDHGLADLPAEQRRRWFKPESTPCRWRHTLEPKELALREAPRPCECPTWAPGVFMRTGLEGLGEAQIMETWIEVPVGAWIVAYRLVNDQGVPVVGELRMFPAEPGRPGPGQWSGELLGPEARVPRGGITARVLRRVRVRAYLTRMSEVVHQLRVEAPTLASGYGWAVAEPAAPEAARLGARRGPKGRPDTFYAEVAHDYVKAVERGSYRPVADLARRRRASPTKIRDMVRRARARGLLTLEGPGKLGGVLTDRAHALIRSTVRRTPSRSSRPTRRARP